VTATNPFIAQNQADHEDRVGDRQERKSEATCHEADSESLQNVPQNRAGCGRGGRAIRHQQMRVNCGIVHYAALQVGRRPGPDQQDRMSADKTRKIVPHAKNSRAVLSKLGASTVTAAPWLAQRKIRDLSAIVMLVGSTL
jgi:hypothetical protein